MQMKPKAKQSVDDGAVLFLFAPVLNLFGELLTLFNFILRAKKKVFDGFRAEFKNFFLLENGAERNE
jgi:hypothetical protein